MNQVEKDTEIEGNKNSLLEEKIKNEVENTLNMAEEGEGGKKKKPGDKKQEKKPEAKKPEAKKDKKALEEEERKKKEEEELKLKEEQEKKEARLKEFNKEQELKGFGAETTFKDITGDRSCHWKFNIPLFYRQHQDKSDQKENNNNRTENLKVSFIEVHTTCVEKVLVFDKTEIDFGEVSVLTRKTVNLVITNNSNKVAKLSMKPMVITNCFRIVNAIRDIAPHASFNYIVEFLPQKDLPYFDDFTIYTEKTQSTVHLKGLGVKPEVETSVPDNILFIGNSMANNTIEGTFDIINKSNFKINFELKSLKICGSGQHDGI